MTKQEAKTEKEVLPFDTNEIIKDKNIWNREAFYRERADLYYYPKEEWVALEDEARGILEELVLKKFDPTKSVVKLHIMPEYSSDWSYIEQTHVGVELLWDSKLADLVGKEFVNSFRLKEIYKKITSGPMNRLGRGATAEETAFYNKNCWQTNLESLVVIKNGLGNISLNCFSYNYRHSCGYECRGSPLGNLGDNYENPSFKLGSLNFYRILSN